MPRGWWRPELCSSGQRRGVEVGENASVLPWSRKPASSLRAGERWPTRPARTRAHPSPAPGRPCHVPVSSSGLLTGTRPRLISPAVPPTRTLMFSLFVPRFRGSVFIGGPNFAGTSKPLRSHRRRSTATASGIKRKELCRVRPRALQLGPCSEAGHPLLRAPPGGQGRRHAALIGRGPSCLFAGDLWGERSEGPE